MLVKDRPHSQSLPEEHGAQSVSPTMSSTVPEPAPYLDSVTELLRTTISFLSPEEGRTAAGEGIDLLWKRFVALLEPRLQDLSSEELAVPGAPPGTGVVLLVHQAHQFIEQLVHGSRDSTEPLLREALRESLYGVQRWSLSATDREEIPDTLRGERTLEGRASRAFQNIDPSSTGATRATIAPDPAPVFRGRIETDDDFFRTRMPIERAQIVISSAAHLLEAHHFFALLRAANPEDLSIPTESELVTRTPLPGKREGERAEKEADITIHLSPDGSTVLPVPFGAEVVAVELSPPQEGGEPLFLEYSVFGPVTLCGLSEEVEVTIRLQRSAQAHITDPDLLARIRKHLPSFEVPLSPGIRALFAEAQTHFDEVQRTELVGSYARSHAPLYTQDPLSQQLLDYSGENGLAFLEGHGGGTCLTMAARVSNLTNLSGGAGYVVCGPVVQNNRFVVVPGHAQGATLRSDAALWQDLTIAAHRPDPKNVQQISEEEQQVLLEEVFEHQPEDVRRAGRACRELLLRPVEKKEGSQKTITRREQNGHTFREAEGDLWVGKRPRQRFPENVHTELLQGYPKEDLWQLRESYAALPPDGFDEQQVEEQRNAITRELVNRFNDPEVPHHEKVSAITWAINLPGRHASWLLHVEDLVTLLPYDLSEQLELLNIFLNAPLSSHLSEAEQLSLSQRLGDITETYDLRRGESRSLRSRIEGFFDEFPTLSLPVAQALAEVYCKASPQDGESFLTALACSKYTVRDGEFSQTGKRMLAAIQAAGIEQPYFSGTPPTLTEAGERLADETLKKRICEIAEGSTYDLFDFLIEQHYLGDLSNHQELLEEQLLLCAEKLDEQGQLVALPFGRNPLSRRFLGVRSRLSSTLAVLCQRGYVGSDISTRWPIQSDGELLKRCSYAELTMEYGDVRLNLGGGRFNGTPSADVEDLLLATAEKKRSSEDELAELISFFSSFPAPQPFSSSISDFDSLFEQEPPEETATREVFNQVVDLLAERHTPDELRTFMFQKIRDLLGHSADSRKLAFSVAALRATGSDSSVGETARSWRDAVQKGRSFREALQSAPALKAFHQKANSIGLSERYQYGALLYLAEFGSLSAKIQSTRKKALIMAAESFQRDPSYRAREGEDPILAQMVRSLPGTAHADYQRIVIGLLEGRRKAQRQIPHGSENQGQRMYTPGDDTRRIHHKASARSDRLVIKVGSDDISFDKTHVHVEAGKLQQEENLSELLHYLTTLAQEGNAVSLSLYWGGGCIRHFSSREVREAISSLVQAEPFSVAGKSEARERFIQETGELAEKAANICETTEKEIGLRNLIPRSDTRSVLYTCETSREIRGALDSKLRHLRQRYLLSKEQLSLA